MELSFSWIKEIRAQAGEFFITLIFIFTICATGLNEARMGASMGSLSAAVSTGFAAVALIYAFVQFAPSHFNPAVTLGAIISKKTTKRSGLVLMVSQLVAGLAAVGLCKLFYGEDSVERLVLKPGPDITRWQAGLMEMFLTFILVLVVYGAALRDPPTPEQVALDLEANPDALINREEIEDGKTNFAPLAIGFALGFLCFLGGSVSGGAFNPVRVLAPMIWTGRGIGDGLVYIGSELVGGALAAYLYKQAFQS